MGALTDIDQEGFAAAALHAFPDMLKPDPLSGDYGPNFFGHAWDTATYVVKVRNSDGSGSEAMWPRPAMWLKPGHSIPLAPESTWRRTDSGSLSMPELLICSNSTPKLASCA
jgi:Family of unknown function (DUF5695)